MATEPNKLMRRRFSLVLRNEDVLRIKTLQRDTAAETWTATIRDALAFYERHHLRKGGE